jgi:hypothetical protein
MLAAISRNASKANGVSELHLFLCLPWQVHKQKFPIGPQSLPTPRHRGPTDAPPPKCRIDHQPDDSCVLVAQLHD